MWKLLCLASLEGGTAPRVAWLERARETLTGERHRQHNEQLTVRIKDQADAVVQRSNAQSAA